MRALVLCGGYGRRLGAHCAERPKPLLRLDEMTILEHILGHLARAHVSEVWINLHHKGSHIPALLGTGPQHGMNVTYLWEQALRGTAGTAADLVGQVQAGDLMIHYGDIVTDHPLEQLELAHQRHGGDATMLVHRRLDSNSRAWVDDSNRVGAFEERPRHALIEGGAQPWAFSGICVVTASCLHRMPTYRPLDLPRDIFPVLAEQGALYAQHLAGYRCAIDSPERLESARRALRDGSYRPPGMERTA